MVEYCCYFSIIDLQGNKLKLVNTKKMDCTYKILEAESVKQAAAKFSMQYPTLRMIGIKKNR